MKSNIMVLIILSTILCSFTACSIEGEPICGIWNSETTNGKMTIEITPWKGKFYGYLLSYEGNGTSYKGAKTEEHVILTDLVFEDNVYKKGSIFLDLNSEESCEIGFTFINDNQLKANYNCDDQTWEETWTRNGFNNHKVEVLNNDRVSSSVNSSTTEKDKAANVSKKVKNTPSAKIKKERTNTPISKKPKTPTKSYEDTTKKNTFYVIGLKKVVAYDNMKEMTKAVEDLWASVYENDFSGKLNNITEQDKMYVVYSNYDQPKGMMTITLGYQVTDLQNIPEGLNGITAPSNEYLVYPLSGEASDYEGEGWNQLEELIMYRNQKSVDFEVYTFDNNYEVTAASIWFGTK